MKIKNVYSLIGLTDNPFGVFALSPDERGERLLVGREDDLQTVARSLHKPGKITCLDGQVGVGKTSLVNVAAYKCYKLFLQGETSQLLIPSAVSFQLKKDGNIDEFCQDVFLGIAQTLIKYSNDLRQYNLPNSINFLFPIVLQSDH